MESVSTSTSSTFNSLELGKPHLRCRRLASKIILSIEACTLMDQTYVHCDDTNTYKGLSQNIGTGIDAWVCLHVDGELPKSGGGKLHTVDIPI